jgi:hypothetical protein
MKKTPILFTVYCLLFTWVAFAYTSKDVSNAVLLANEGIIVQRTDTDKYRLDDTITRAEAIGVAMKLGWIHLPETYLCRDYFSDVQQRADNWICRAVELAADNALVTRANKRFRPQDTITRAEALAIMVSAGKAEEKLPENWTDESLLIYDGTNTWQTELIAKAKFLGIISSQTYKKDSETHLDFSPNRAATRAEVFEFAGNIIKKKQPLSLQKLWITVTGGGGAGGGGATELTDNGDGSYILIFTEERETTQTPDESVPSGGGASEGPGESEIQGISLLPEPYPKITIKEIAEEPLQEIIKLWFNKPGGIKEYNGIQYFHSITYDMCDGNSYTVFSEEYSYTFAYICGGDYFDVDSQLLSVDGSMQRFDDKDVLTMYYGFLDYPREEWGNAKIYSAYGMRTSMDDSFEVFSISFQNITDVTFRGDTAKSLGNHTYEFLVNMTESWVVSTYKVKSKVNLNSFTLEEIVSEKV